MELLSNAMVMLPNVYFKYSLFIDFIIAFMLFWGVSHHALKERFPDSSMISKAVGLSLAISLVLFEMQYGYSLSKLSFLAVFILIMLIVFIIGKILPANSEVKNYDNLLASNQMLKIDLIKAIEEIKNNHPKKAVKLIEQAELTEHNTKKLIEKLKFLQKDKSKCNCHDKL